MESREYPQSKAFGLLVQKAPGTCGAGGVAFKASVFPLPRPGKQAEFLPTYYEYPQ